jgi:serpin B
MTMRIGSVLGAVSLFALAGCSASSTDNDKTPESSQLTVAKADLGQTPASAISDDSLKIAVTANNAMAVDLYAHVLASSTGGNLLTSPISASLALTMTYAGAVGNTATEMAQALHFDPSVGTAIFDGQNALSQALAARGASALSTAQKNTQYGNQPAPSIADYDLHIVNSVWGEKTYAWEQPFLATLAQSYGTGVYQEDFVHASEPARLAINGWVSEETRDKINDLLPIGILDATTRMVLVNAMHLKFPWDSPFLPANTASGDFTLAGGTSVQANFMHQTAGFSYIDDGQAQIVALPLAGREVLLVVALPHDGVDLATYEATLTSGSAALGVPASTELVDLSLPKAEFTSQTFSLNQALQDMGMKSAFDPGAADFSGLCAHPPDGGRLSVSHVLQKAMISMQETGVEAAAATAVILSGTSNGPNPNPPVPVPMVVNRPYLLALVDKPTGAILMLGQIVDPTDAGTP